MCYITIIMNTAKNTKGFGLENNRSFTLQAKQHLVEPVTEILSPINWAKFIRCLVESFTNKFFSVRK